MHSWWSHFCHDVLCRFPRFGRYLGDAEKIKAAAEAVKNQTKVREWWHEPVGQLVGGWILLWFNIGYEMKSTEGFGQFEYWKHGPGNIFEPCTNGRWLNRDWFHMVWNGIGSREWEIDGWGMMRETPLGNLGNRVKNRIYTVYVFMTPWPLEFGYGTLMACRAAGGLSEKDGLWGLNSATFLVWSGKSWWFMFTYGIFVTGEALWSLKNWKNPRCPLCTRILNVHGSQEGRLSPTGHARGQVGCAKQAKLSFRLAVLESKQKPLFDSHRGFILPSIVGIIIPQYLDPALTNQ